MTRADPDTAGGAAGPTGAISLGPERRARLLSRGKPAPRPSVTRERLVSETGYPYEVHHISPHALPTLPPDKNPIADAEAALAALRPCFADWLAADLEGLNGEVERLRAAPDRDTAPLCALLEGLAGHAGALGRGDVADEAARLVQALRARSPLGPVLDGVAILVGAAEFTAGNA